MLLRTFATLTFLTSIIHTSSSVTAEYKTFYIDNNAEDNTHKLALNYLNNRDYVESNPNNLSGPTKKLYDYITSEEDIISAEKVESFKEAGAHVNFAFAAAIRITTAGINHHPLCMKELMMHRVTKCAQYNDASIQHTLLRTLICKSRDRSLDALKILLQYNDIKKIDPDSSLLFESFKNFEAGAEVLDLLAKKGANVNTKRDGVTLYQAMLKTFQPDQQNYLMHRQDFCKSLLDNGYKLNSSDVAAIKEAKPR